MTIDTAAPDAAVIALLTPAALRDPRVLGHLGGSRGAGKSALPLAASLPAACPTPDDLVRIIEWLHAPALAAAPKFHIPFSAVALSVTSKARATGA